MEQGSLLELARSFAQFVLVVVYTAHIRHKPVGILRLLYSLPTHIFLCVFPWSIASITVRGGIAFIFSWLGNAKLLAYSANRGPLAQPGLSSWQFLALLLLPVTSAKQVSTNVRDGPKVSTWVVLPLKLAAFLGLSVALTSSILTIPDWDRHAIYAIYIYLVVSLMLDSTLPVAQAVLSSQAGPNSHSRLQLQQGMYAPFLSTSIQEFWGSRYNLVVSATLADVVYAPIVERSWIKPHAHAATLGPPKDQLGSNGVSNAASFNPTNRAKDQLGSNVASNGMKEAPLGSGQLQKQPGSTAILVDARDTARVGGARKLVALAAAFAVSGVMHELMVWYMCKGDVKPSGRMMAFFLAQPVLIWIEQTAQRYLTWMRNPACLTSKRWLRAWAVVVRMGQSVWTAGCLLCVAEMFFWEPMTTACDIDKRGLAEVVQMMEQAKSYWVALGTDRNLEL